ncbi:hypothetical protein NZK35_29095 [Stieleria sp. ICT_E10.1]|uniref:hypothetical protein n=1 Tax=Stieleria sedimenti TaxID=2976331 RepID=UPI00217F29FF|nr:hypothetical protein [Stieleria sedimenti]MCS7470729.1 hypothetical protein [Stieleria sedimenti]
METISPEQFLALGAVTLAMIGGILLTTFALAAGSLKLSIHWIGNASPGYLACFGWLVAMYFVNGFIAVAAQDLLGQAGVLIAIPLSWFVTLYMTAHLANCGLFRAFGIWIVNGILNAIGCVVIFFFVLIPLLTMIPDPDKGSQAEIQDVDEMLTEMEAQMQDFDSQMNALDQMEIPEIKQVHFEPEQTATETRNSEPTVAPTPSTKPTKVAPVPSSRPRTKTVRRAADGTMVNPFFQD